MADATARTRRIFRSAIAVLATGDTATTWHPAELLSRVRRAFPQDADVLEQVTVRMAAGHLKTYSTLPGAAGTVTLDTSGRATAYILGGPPSDAAAP